MAFSATYDKFGISFENAYIKIINIDHMAENPLTHHKVHLAVYANKQTRDTECEPIDYMLVRLNSVRGVSMDNLALVYTVIKQKYKLISYEDV